jgi:hypothetical protein
MFFLASFLLSRLVALLERRQGRRVRSVVRQVDALQGAG